MGGTDQDPQHPADVDLSRPPQSPVRAELQVVVNQVGPVDMVASEVRVRLELSVNWKDERLVSAEDAMARNVWVPRLNVFNRNKDAVVFQSPLFFDPKSKVCGLDITFDGMISVSHDMSNFPFDGIDLKIIVDACDAYLHDGVLDLRVVPIDSFHKECFGDSEDDKNGQYSLKLGPTYDPTSFRNEWFIMGAGVEEVAEKWSRTYQRVFITIRLIRQPMNYIYKVAFPVFVIDFFTMGAFVASPIDEYMVRMTYVATLVIATAALLLTVNAEIPNLPYLTKLDRLMLHAFIIQLWVALLTMAFGVASHPHWTISETALDNLHLADFTSFLFTVPLIFAPVYWLIVPPMCAFNRRMSRGPQMSSDLCIPCTDDSSFGKADTTRLW